MREVRDGQHISPDAPKSILDPLWMSELNWPTITAPDHVQQLLETVLPQVPAVPRGFRHGARVRARRVCGSRLRRGSDRVDRYQDRRDPQSLGLCGRSWLQPAAVCLGCRGHEEPQLAGWTTPGCSRPIPASDPRSARPANLQRIFASMVHPITATVRTSPCTA